MKKFIYLIMIASVFISMLMPYDIKADEGIVDYSDAIGVKEVKNNHTDVVYTGKHWDNEDGNTLYEYKATIHQAPIYNDDGTLVDCRWYGIKGSYYINDNVFSVSITGAKTDVTYQGEVSSWNPVVIVDNKEYTAIGDPKIINDPNNENYVGNVLEWDYGICKRQLRVIEGLIQDQWIFSQDPKGNVWIRDNATKSKDFTWIIEPYGYDADGNSIVVNEYKQVAASVMAGAVYPVTIDPTEVFITSASDGFLRYIDPVYVTAHDAANAEYVYSTLSYLFIGQQFVANYQIDRSYVYFDTSSLPDSAIISASNLSLYGQTDGSTANFNIVVQNGQPDYPHDPLVVGDYDYTKYAGAGSAFSTAGFVTTGYNNISLTAAGLTYISLTGTTKLALLSSEDIADSAPAGSEYVSVFSYEKGAGYRPTLYVTYASSGTPTVTTNPATYITKTSARLNGYLDSDGGEICDVWFEYARWNGSAWVGNTSTAIQNKETGDSFFQAVSGLTTNSTYTYRAVAENSLGVSNGSYVNFSTSVILGNPSNVLCSPEANSITLSWVKGGNTSSTYIRWKLGTYPTGTTDGNVLALQSGSSYEHTGLVSGQTYYYKMWGEDSGEYSTSNSTLMCTTTAGYSGSTPNPLPTIDTDDWFNTPNGSALSTNPLYPIGNEIASAGGLTQATFWLGTGFLILIVVAIFIWKYTRKLEIMIIAVIVFGIIMANMGLFPLWTMIAFGVTGIGFGWKELR